MRKKWTNRGRSALAAIALASLATSSFAQIDTTWLGGNGSWNDSINWSNGVPNNGGGVTYHAVIPSGSINATGSISIDSLTLASGASIASADYTNWTITGATEIDGSWIIGSTAPSTGQLTLGNNGVLAGSGTVIMGSVSYSSPLIASSGSLTIASGMTVRFLGGTGSIGTASQPLVNHGQILFGNATVPDVPSLAGTPIINDGVVSGYPALDGSINTAQLGTMTGSPQIRGTLNNAGQTLLITSATQWELGSGTISGGTIQTAAGQVFQTAQYLGGGALDHTFLRGNVLVWDKTLYFEDGDITGQCDIQLSQGAEGPTRINSKNFSDITVGSGIVIHGGGGFDLSQFFGLNDGIDASSANINNHGVIRSDNPKSSSGNGEFSLLAGTVFNDGTLKTLSKSFLYANHNVTFEPGGVLDVQISTTTGLGLLRLGGALDLTTSGDAVALSTSSGIVPGTFYRIVTAGSITGTFDSVTPGFEVEYLNGNEIWARFVPEPSCVTFALAPASMCLLRRRARART